MSELEQDNELRQFLQNSFEDEESTPPRGVYAEILKKIDVKIPWWKLPLTWFTFSIVLLFIPICFILFNKNKNNKINKNNKNENTEINIISKNENNEDISKPKNNIKTNSNNISENSNYNVNKKEDLSLTSKTINKQTENVIKDKITFINKSKFEKSVDSKNNLSFSSNNIENINKQNEHKSIINDNNVLNNIKQDNNIENDVKNVSSDTLNEELKSENKNDSIVKNIDHKESIDTIKKQNTVSINSNTFNDSIKDKKRSYKWSIYFAPNVGFQTRVVVPGVNMLLQNELTKRRRHLLSSSSISMDLAYKFSSKWSLIGGFYLTHAKGKSKVFEKYIVKNSNDYEISSPEGNIRIDNSELNNSFSNSDSSLFKIKLKYKSNQLSFPLTLKYTFSDKIIQTFFRFGVSMDVETKRLSTINVKNTENLVQNDFVNKNPQLGKAIQGIFSIGVQSNFNSRFNTFIELYNGVGLSPYLRQSNYKVRINYHQLRFGIKFSF